MYLSEENKNINSKKFHSTIISKNQDMEAITVFICMDTEDIHNIYHKKRIKSCHLGQQDRPGGYYTWQNKSDRERQILYAFTYT